MWNSCTRNTLTKHGGNATLQFKTRAEEQNNQFHILMIITQFRNSCLTAHVSPATTWFDVVNILFDCTLLVQKKCSRAQLWVFVKLHCYISSFSAYPHRLKSFNLLVQVVVDVTGVEQRVSGNLAQQIPSEVADVVFAEVPLPQHPAGNHGLRVLVAALAEVAAEVLAVAQPLDVI